MRKVNASPNVPQLALSCFESRQSLKFIYIFRSLQATRYEVVLDPQRQAQGGPGRASACGHAVAAESSQTGIVYRHLSRETGRLVARAIGPPAIRPIQLYAQRST